MFAIIGLAIVSPFEQTSVGWRVRLAFQILHLAFWDGSCFKLLNCDGAHASNGVTSVAGTEWSPSAVISLILAKWLFKLQYTPARLRTWVLKIGNRDFPDKAVPIGVTLPQIFWEMAVKSVAT